MFARLTLIHRSLPARGLRAVALSILLGCTVGHVSAETSSRITELEIVSVLGEQDRTAELPGSHDVLDAEELIELHVMTTSEALRKAAGDKAGAATGASPSPTTTSAAATPASTNAAEAAIVSAGTGPGRHTSRRCACSSGHSAASSATRPCSTLDAWDLSAPE